MVPPDDRRLFPELPASANEQDIYLGVLIVLLVVGLVVGATRCAGSPLARFNGQLRDAGAGLAPAPSTLAGERANATPRAKATPPSSPPVTTATPATTARTASTPASGSSGSSAATAAPASPTGNGEPSSPSLTLVAPPWGGLPPTGLAATLAELSSQTNAMFSTGGLDIVPASRPILDRLAAVLLGNPTVRIQVAGHTDTNGDEQTNDKLGQQRAEAVRDYLVASGIAPPRLIAVGYGGSRPVAGNDSPEGRALNRRIEFLLVP